MSRNHFQFKRFAIEQDGCAMKVGTDGVLLGAWCRLRPEDKAILDIGTGTGVIALQLAQRTEHTGAHIEALEPDAASAACARRNFDASGWGSRLTLHETTAQKFALALLPPLPPTPSSSPPPPQSQSATCNTPARFDHIVSNPPYFINSLASPDPSRTTARHTDTLSYRELITACDTLLRPGGRISLILPAGTEAGKMTAQAAAQGLFATRRTEVHSTPKSGPKRLLLEFSRETPVAPELSSLVIEDPKPCVAKPGTIKFCVAKSAVGVPTAPTVPTVPTFSTEYRTLTRDFYLYF